MTTVAWDGKMLAADRRVSYGTMSDANTTKIVKSKKGLCGAAGNTAMCAAFKRWFLAGEKGESPALARDGESATACIVRPDGVRIMYDSYGWYEVDPGPFALGSGWEIAMGALRKGASAQEAVAIAASIDGATGNEIDVLEM